MLLLVKDIMQYKYPFRHRMESGPTRPFRVEILPKFTVNLSAVANNATVPPRRRGSFRPVRALDSVVRARYGNGGGKLCMHLVAGGLQWSVPSLTTRHHSSIGRPLLCGPGDAPPYAAGSWPELAALGW